MSKKRSILIAVLLVFCLVAIGCSDNDTSGQDPSEKLSPKHRGT